MRHEKVASELTRNIWGLLTKPFNASPGTRSTTKHMIQRAQNPLFLTLAVARRSQQKLKIRSFLLKKK